MDKQARLKLRCLHMQHFRMVDLHPTGCGSAMKYVKGIGYESQVYHLNVYLQNKYQ